MKDPGGFGCLVLDRGGDAMVSSVVVAGTASSVEVDVVHQANIAVQAGIVALADTQQLAEVDEVVASNL